MYIIISLLLTHVVLTLKIQNSFNLHFTIIALLVKLLCYGVLRDRTEVFQMRNLVDMRR